jgi:hypothetical protein
MLRVRFAIAFGCSAVLLPLGLWGCADTLSSEETKSSTTLQREYENTLTKAEREAAISELQNATAKRQNAEPPESASGAADSAEKQE